MRANEDTDAGASGGGRHLVVALHCSGGSPRQWRKLGERIEGHAELLTPLLVGSEGGEQWHGERAFTLADEAERILPAIDRHDGPVHLVGHSYGGGVALHLASVRPSRVASLGLYEPSAFHLLKHMGAVAGPAYVEIVSVAADVRDGLASGDHRQAAKSFVDYWNGDGAFEAMKPEQRAAMMRYVPKACLDFAALLGERTAPDAYTVLRAPTLVLRGAEGPEPTRLVASMLLGLLPEAELASLDGAGHMGPMTHGDLVASLIGGNILRQVRFPETTERLRAA